MQNPLAPQNAQTAPIAPAAPVSPSMNAVLTAAQVTVLACSACVSKATKQIDKYELTVQHPDGTQHIYELSLDSWNAIQENPALKQSLQLETRRLVDKKGKPFTSRFAYVSGFSKHDRQQVAW